MHGEYITREDRAAAATTRSHTSVCRLTNCIAALMSQQHHE